MMFRHFTIAAVIIFVFSLGAEKIVWGENKNAYQLYESGEYGKASERFRALADKAPEDGTILYNLALSEHKSGAHEQAEKNFLRALTLNRPPEESSTLYNLGNNLFRRAEKNEESKPESALDFYSKALQYYRKSIQLDRSDEDAVFNYEFTRRRMSELEKSVSEKRQEQEPQKPKEQKNDATSQDEQRPPEEDSSSGQPEEEGSPKQEKPSQEEASPEETDASQRPDQTEKGGEQKDEDTEQTSEEPRPGGAEDMVPDANDSGTAQMEMSEGGMDPETARFLLRMQQEEEDRKRAEEKRKDRESASERVLRDW